MKRITIWVGMLLMMAMILNNCVYYGGGHSHRGDYGYYSGPAFYGGFGYYGHYSRGQHHGHSDRYYHHR